MDPSFSAPRPVPLSPEDRTILARRQTVYRNILIGAALLVGGSWLSVSVTVLLGDPDLNQDLLIVTIAGPALVSLGIWGFSIYLKNLTAPLTRDLDDDQKICLVGEIIKIRHSGRGGYIKTIIVRTQCKTDLEEFILPPYSERVAHEALVVGSEIALEYTPHARFILRLALKVPLTPQEQQQRRTEGNKSLVDVLLGVSALLLGLGWLVNLLVPFAALAALVVVIVSGAAWYSRQ